MNTKIKNDDANPELTRKSRTKTQIQDEHENQERRRNSRMNTKIKNKDENQESRRNSRMKTKWRKKTNKKWKRKSRMKTKIKNQDENQESRRKSRIKTKIKNQEQIFHMVPRFRYKAVNGCLFTYLRATNSHHIGPEHWKMEYLTRSTCMKRDSHQLSLDD